MTPRHSRQINDLKCPICSQGPATVYRDEFILGKFSAALNSCENCGHEWFHAPEVWLPEAYSSPIANTDTGIASRSLNLCRIISSFLSVSNISGKILDWGSGSGLLTRLLRDDGHDCYGLEPFTDPVLAKGYTYNNQQEAYSNGPYRAIIAVEVVEHLVRPSEFFKAALSNTDTLIFSTELVDRVRYGNEWWYYSKETGQHISFYTEKSLALLAGQNTCRYASARNKSLHIITRKPSDLRLFSWLAGSRRSHIIYPLSKVLWKLKGKHSLIRADHLAAKHALLCSRQES